MHVGVRKFFLHPPGGSHFEYYLHVESFALCLCPSLHCLIPCARNSFWSMMGSHTTRLWG